jgi:AcrR family transcriptional regulator
MPGRPADQTPVRPRRRPGRPPRLDRDMILRAAATVDPAELSMPALAESLGVTTPALYNYFPSKKALLTALATDVLDQIKMPSPTGTGWRIWLSTLADALRTLFIQNPDTAEELPAALRSAQFRLMDDTYTVMLSHGFRAEDVPDAFELVRIVALSNAHIKRNSHEWRSWTERPQDVLAAMAGALRNRAELINAYQSYDVDVAFTAQLKIVLDGIGQRAGLDD